MKITKEVKIAITAVVALGLLFFGLNFLKGHMVFANDNSYKVAFKDIQGLSASSPVYADGYKVGVVQDIEYDFNDHGDIMVLINVDKQLRIPAGSTASVSADLMGNVKVDLLLANNPRERVEPGGVIKGVVDEGALGEVKKFVPIVQDMLPKMDSILVAVNILLQDPAIANSLHNVEGITTDLRTTAAGLKVLIANVNGQVPSMMNKANTVLDNTTKLTANLAQVDIQETMTKVNRALDNVDAFTGKLNSDEGTLGKLMHDPAMYNNLTHLLSSTDSLVTDLKAHPKRYVHFSLFGSKTK